MNTRLNSQGKGAKLAAASKEDSYSWFQGFDSHSQEQYYFQMVERAFKLVIEQLFQFMQVSNVNHNNVLYAKWSAKMRKIYKALRLMEVHKKADPKFARPLKLLLPHLSWPTGDKSNGDLASDNEQNEGIKSNERLIINLAGDKGTGCSVSIGRVNLDGSFTGESGIAVDE